MLLHTPFSPTNY